MWDTEGDKLPDGWVNVSTTPGVDGWTGEDKNLNGSRDLDSEGNYTETDFLANDSDVDGILDGAETNGTWGYASGVAGCPGEDNTACKLDPLNPDFDRDTKPDANHTDADGDAIAAPRVDKNQNGRSEVDEGFS